MTIKKLVTKKTTIKKNNDKERQR